MAEQAIIIETHGGPEAMSLRDITLPPPCEGEVRVRHSAIGLNFIDMYHRSGLYPVALPSGLGMEAAGTVEAVGPGVAGLAVGDRVASFTGALGAYATARNVAAMHLARLPDGVSDEVAAAAILKGCTTEALIERCARVQAGDWVLVHAAAGGMGLLLTQWLKHIGARVIGVVSTAAKAEKSRAAGADHVLVLTADSIAEAVRDLTGGDGVAVTFDGVGKDTWAASLKATRRRGLIISYGNASGPVTGIGLAELASAGSLFVTRPTMFDYYREPAEREAGIARVMHMLSGGVLSVDIGQRYPLADAAQAHRDLADRRTTGSTILIP
mgnify:CR=1 FL=1